jgi:hypothetical protein
MELGIETPWMLTVMGVMAAYGVLTIIGVLKKRKNEAGNK